MTANGYDGPPMLRSLPCVGKGVGGSGGGGVGLGVAVGPEASAEKRGDLPRPRKKKLMGLK